MHVMHNLNSSARVVIVLEFSHYIMEVVEFRSHSRVSIAHTRTGNVWHARGTPSTYWSALGISDQLHYYFTMPELKELMGSGYVRVIQRLLYYSYPFVLCLVKGISGRSILGITKCRYIFQKYKSIEHEGDININIINGNQSSLLDKPAIQHLLAPTSNLQHMGR